MQITVGLSSIEDDECVSHGHDETSVPNIRHVICNGKLVQQSALGDFVIDLISNLRKSIPFVLLVCGYFDR